MKKSLIALAALATVATAAQAQSSVTVYGVMDAGVATMNNANTKSATTGGTWTGMANGGLSTSRFGFAGSEDLGGGLKANFKLEAQLFPSTGVAGAQDAKGVQNYSSNSGVASGLFSRESTVGLSGSFGEVKLGRANTVGYDKAVQFDPLGYGNFGSLNTYDPTVIARANNQVKYYSPVIQGVQAGLSYSTPGVAGDSDVGSLKEAALTYSNHGLELLAAYAVGNTFGTNASAANNNENYGKRFGVITGAGGVKGTEVWQFAASYKVDALKLTAGYDTKKDNSAAVGTPQNNKVTQYIGAAYSINPSNAVALAYYNYNDKTLSAGKSNMTTAIYTYTLTKRTDIYGIISHVNNATGTNFTVGDNSNIWVSGASNDASKPYGGRSQDGYMVGLRHKF